MDRIKMVKTPTTVKGRTLKFGAIYGKINGIIYLVEHYDQTEALNNQLTFEFWREREIIHTKKHGDYVRGGYWQRCVSSANGKYATIVAMCLDFILKYQLWTKQPTPYVRNRDFNNLGAPQEKKPQTYSGYQYRAKAGYALNKYVITDTDPKRRIRQGVTYFPA